MSWKERLRKAIEYKYKKIPKLKEPNKTLREIEFSHIVSLCRELEKPLEKDLTFHLFIQYALYGSIEKSDDQRYLFIGDIPIRMPKHSMAKQCQVEMWLSPLVANQLKKLEKPEPDLRYIT